MNRCGVNLKKVKKMKDEQEKKNARPAPMLDPEVGDVDGQCLSTVRLTVTMDGTSHELLKRLQKHTALSPAQILMKLLPAHLHELWAYLDWLEGQPPGELKHRGMYLLHNYGPDDLIQSIKHLDPTYVTPGEQMLARVAAMNVRGPAE